MKKLSFLMIMTLVLGLTACGKADDKVDKKDFISVLQQKIKTAE